MEGYGYSYQTKSTYNPVGSRTEDPSGPATRRPFVPFVPNSNRSPEGYVTRKIVVPVATKPYGDDYSHYGSPTKAYPPRYDDEYWQRQTSPVHSRPPKVDDFLTKVQNEASRPPRFTPDSSPVRNDSYYGNGYGDYGNYNDKERYKPIGRNDKYDRYHPAAENYGSLEPNRNYGSGWSRPNWTAPPRNGTQLSEPTNDIGKAVGLLKEAAKVSSNGYGDHSSKGRAKDESYYGAGRPNPSIWAEPPGTGGSHVREPGKVDKAVELARQAERLMSLNKILSTTPRKDDTYYREKDDSYYREPVDTSDATRRYGNINFKSGPRPSPPTVFNNRNY